MGLKSSVSCIRSRLEHLDVSKNRASCLSSRDEAAMPRQFVVEVGEETLDDGIIVTVALATHACLRKDTSEFKWQPCQSGRGKAPLSLIRPGLRPSYLVSHCRLSSTRDEAISLGRSNNACGIFEIALTNLTAKHGKVAVMRSN